MTSSSGRPRRDWGRTLSGLAIAAAAVAAAVVRPSPAIADAGGTARTAFAALASSAIVALAVLPLAVWRRTSRRFVWLTVSALALLAGIGIYAASGATERQCTAPFNGRLFVIGTEPTPNTAAYLAANPQHSPQGLLFDATGVPESVWTKRSIDRCRARLAATYFLWVPFLFVSLVAAVHAAGGQRLSAPAPSSRFPAEPSGAAVPERYDVFISYRHGAPDAAVALQLVEALEADGYVVAIDERDFPANQSFLEEMERCIRQSRFTVAVVSPRYLASGNCQEEAIVCKVLDMGERRRRLIPIVIEPVAMPAWLYGIVGIDITKKDSLLDPIEKLKTTIGPPLAAAPTKSAV